MSKRGVNKEYLKKRNRGLVLQLVATGKCISRTDLAKETGLTKTAISAIVNELIEKKYLKEVAGRKEEPEIKEQGIKEPGRIPVRLEISSDSPKYAGVLIGRECAEAVLCDMTLKMYKYERIEQEWEGEADLMDAVCRLLDHILEGREDVIAVGVSTPGPVDVKKGMIVSPGYFHNIKNVSVVEILQSRYKMPIFLDHDIQSVALVEQLYGNGKGYQDVLVVGIDEGVGSGIIAGGRRYQSNSGYPPEIGHFSIDPHGNKCIMCGNIGCLETYIGTKVIEKKVEKVLGEKKSYFSICQMGDNRKVREIMEAMIMDLSSAVVSLENIFNFEIILLGVDSVYWPETYVKMLEDIVNERKYANKNGKTLVKKVSFLDKTMVLGAVCNAVNKTFGGELLD